MIQGAWRWVLFFLVVAFIPAVNLALGRNDLDPLRHDPAETWGRAVLDGLKPNAVLFTVDDHDIFVSGYLLKVAGLRPDVTLMDRGDYMTPPNLRVTAWPFLPDAERRKIQRERLWQFLEAGRPVYAPFFPQRAIPPGWVARADGFLSTLVRETGGDLVDRHEEAEALLREKLLPLSAEKAGWTPFLWNWVSHGIAQYYLAEARTALAQQDQPRLKAVTSELHRLGQKSPPVLVQLGELYMQGGPENFPQAYLFFEGAIRLARDLWLQEPAEAWLDMGILSFEQGDLVKSLYQSEQATRLKPTLARAFLQIGQCYHELGKKAAAAEAFARAVALDPELASLIPQEGREDRPSSVIPRWLPSAGGGD